MTKKITYQRLYNITLYYLSRYEASGGKVRDMLKRRLLRVKNEGGEIPAEVSDWIQEIINRMQELGYINDTRYAETQIRQLSAQGKSARFISGKLAQAGINSDTVQDLMTESDDLTRAQRFVQRKKLGYLRPENVRSDFYQKDLMALGRAGFSYETAVQALKETD